MMVDTSGLDKLVRDLESFQRDLLAEMLPAMQEAVHITEAAVKDRTPVARGNLAGSINSQVTSDDNSVTGVVGTNAPYAPWVELDCRPHWPPLAPLIEWARDSHLAGVYSIRTQRRLGSQADQARQNRALARAVQVKISREGTRGKQMFAEGLAAVLPQIEQIFTRAAARAVGRVMGRR
jgi:hypothetical protein